MGKLISKKEACTRDETVEQGRFAWISPSCTYAESAQYLKGDSYSVPAFISVARKKSLNNLLGAKGRILHIYINETRAKLF